MVMRADSYGKCIVRHIRDYSENNGQVYAFINLISKKVYIGETGDGENRELTHALCIFGLEDKGSNQNLIDEKQSGGFCLLQLYSFPDKSKCDKEWLAMETIYMYLFVKHGYQLYNSNNGRDNIGKKRKFLVEKTDRKELKEYLMAFLKAYQIPKDLVNQNSNEEACCISDWDDLLKIAEKILIEDLINAFGSNIFVDMDLNERKALWNKFVEDKRVHKDFIVLENMKNIQDFFVFNKERLKANRQEYEIKQVSIKKLLEKNKLDYIIYTKAGDYLGETLYQILFNKFADLQCKYDPFEKQYKDTGMCFWSVAGDQQEWISRMLSSKCDKKDVYMLLFYTGSKNLSTALPKEKKAKTFSLKRKDEYKYEYPDFYVDELLGNRKNMAFLIADFYYPKEEIVTDMIETAYEGMFESSAPSYICSGYNQKTYYLATIKANDKKRLLQIVEGAKEDTNQTRMILARLTYPYVVAIDE
ncbi:MAG: hypothetical protein IJB96_00875 [Lachnospira sp.]|nr:hypothetical protein [Lachnospira sp.]